MNKTTLFTLGVCAMLLAGCRWMGIKGDGNRITEQRQVEDFDEIQSSGMFEVEWTAGAPSLSLTTDKNLMGYIETTVSDRKLRLRTRERILPTRGLKVAISSTKRNGAKMSGASGLVARGLMGPSFAVETAGAADITLDGAVDLLVADMTGAGELQAKALQTKVAEISATGASDVEVAVSDRLRVSITGAGDVTYHGNPTVEKKITGAGEIRKKE